MLLITVDMSVVLVCPEAPETKSWVGLKDIAQACRRRCSPIV